MAVISSFDIATEDMSALVSRFNDNFSNVNDPLSNLSATGSVVFVSTSTRMLGSLTVLGDISVGGGIALAALSGGVLTVTDSGNISGTLSVGSAAVFSANIGIVDSAIISGDVQVGGSVQVSGVLLVCGATTIASNLTVTVDTTLSGNVTAGNLEVSGLAGTSKVVNSMAVCGIMDVLNLHVSGHASFSDSAFFASDVFVCNDVTVCGALTISGGTVSMTGAVGMSGTVGIEGFLTMSGGMQVSGTATFACGLVVCTTLVNIAASTTLTSNVSMAGSVVVTSGLALDQRMQIDNALVVASGEMTSAKTIFLLDTSAAGGNIGFILCAVSDNVNQLLMLKRIDSAANTCRLLVCAADDLIDGSAAVDLASRGGLVLYSDGVEWFAMGSATFA